MINIKQAVILAGGQGLRLRPFTLKNPKPMVLVNRRPFLLHLIELLKENGIREVIILTGYLGDKIEKYFGNGSKFDLKIKYSYTPFLDKKGEENKSGLRLKNAQELLDDYFLLMYCDNYWPLQLVRLIKFFEGHHSDVLVTAYSNADNSTKNNILVDKKGYVTEYVSAREGKNLNGVDIGFFIVNKKVLKFLPNHNSKFELDVLPKLIKQRRLAAFISDQKYYSISDLERVKATSKFLYPKKVVFLDRDGVINQRLPKADYVKSWDEFKFLQGSIEAIKLLNDCGYKIFIISNQPGIARGKLTIEDLESIHKNMKRVLKRVGVNIDGIYYCPHNWNEGCSCRKPKPGLLYMASKDHYIDLTRSILIGDDERDIEAGKVAGCQTILVTSRNNLLKIIKKIIL